MKYLLIQSYFTPPQHQLQLQLIACTTCHSPIPTFTLSTATIAAATTSSSTVPLHKSSLPLLPLPDLLLLL